MLACRKACLVHLSVFFFILYSCVGDVMADSKHTQAVSDYQVGAYYMPGWQSGSRFWSDIRPWPDRTPLLGYYPEEETRIADQHIQWAADHGINFFVYDWFWDSKPGRPRLEHALLAHLKSKYRAELRFCILWVNHPPFDRTVEQYKPIVDYWIRNYFNRPEYFKINNIPVVFVFSSGDFARVLGTRAPDVLSAIREQVKKAGYKDIYLVAGDSGVPDAKKIGGLILQGYDGVTAYNYVYTSGPKIASYDDLITGYEKIWNEAYSVIKKISDYLTGKKPIDDQIISTMEKDENMRGKIDQVKKLIGANKKFHYVVPVTPGWDDRPWHGNEAYVRTGSTPEKFKQMLLKAKGFIDAHRADGIVSNMVIIEAWNEFAEGSYIEPTEKWRFGYLDAIRDAFVAAPTQRTGENP
jgi:hypothetical protein